MRLSYNNEIALVSLISVQIPSNVQRSHLSLADYPRRFNFSFRFNFSVTNLCFYHADGGFSCRQNPSRSIKLPVINGNRFQRLKSWFQLFFLCLLLMVCFQSIFFFWQIPRVQR
ncbi:uncharacterized protein LOC103942063 isoform X2 [Pyrus x bretschneideri]|uniref:uncharacterized protein LOC103942063 isoform X2 n=1 Tax=Pyrus x bretschneideri TaxID=225117 RepID=UPI0020304F65|nr:uncharacterized protein LOC103942063 isoform X2 [Pyrus x bretschneideri]